MRCGVFVSRDTYNLHGNVTKTACNGLSVTNSYDTEQKLVEKVDSVSGNTTYEYDSDGQLKSVRGIKYENDENDEMTCYETGVEVYDYNEDKQLEAKTLVYGDISRVYRYEYADTAAKELKSIITGNIKAEPKLDVNGRNTGKVISVDDTKVAEEQIHYLKQGDHATILPSTVRYGNTVDGKFVLMDNVKYKYDSMGNICEVRENGNLVVRYEYDAIGRLVREDNKNNGTTVVFVYDNNGNILSKNIYAFTLKEKHLLEELSCTTVEYAYDAGSDRLMSYNGESFAYDVVGNPTTYRGKSATWAYGRQLQSYNGNTYTYDARGRRLSKKHGTNTAITFTYDESGKLIQQSNGLEFIYDHTGICAVVYNGSTYFYRKNAQNDIISLLDKTGKVVVKYMYDGWGNCSVSVIDSTATTIANLNPFRYRSYYFDTETNLYFLKTRYYDPEIGRFMTIDGISYLNPDSINGLNLYAYCFNNPIAYSDETGCSVWLLIASVVVIGLLTIGGAIWGYHWPKRAESNMEIGNTKPEALPEISNPLDESQNEVNVPEESEENELSVGERIENALIGALLGLSLGGFIVFLAAACVAPGLASTSQVLIRILALGMLATVVASVLALGFGIELPALDENIFENKT